VGLNVELRVAGKDWPAGESYRSFCCFQFIGCLTVPHGQTYTYQRSVPIGKVYDRPLGRKIVFWSDLLTGECEDSLPCPS